MTTHDQNESIADRLGHNIPPNERFMGDQDGWQPGFDPLGHPQPQPAQPEIKQQSRPQPQPTLPAMTSERPQVSLQAVACCPPSRSISVHSRDPWDWIWLPILVVSLSTGLWWMIFAVWPLSRRLKRASQTGNWQPVGKMMVILGGLALLLTGGAALTVLVPVALIGVGGLMLTRSLGNGSNRPSISSGHQV